MFTIEQHGSRAFRTVTLHHQMTATTTATAEEAHAKRWREWQLKNEHDYRKGVRRSRLVFAAIFLAMGFWLAVLLVSSQVS
jgi:hypothetical protein